MKNITEFSKFKNYKILNEEADPRVGGYGGGGDTYFANVKGNFAGADQTLVGSAVIKLFGFVKRKGYQVLLYTWFKPNLYREYMSGLLRYIIRNQMNLPHAKTFYASEYTHTLDMTEVSPKVKLNIKFVAAEGEESGKTYSVFKLGSFVQNESGNNVEDGYYLLTDFGRIIKVEDGKLTELDAKLSENPPPATPPPPPPGDVEMDPDIAEFIQKTEEKYDAGLIDPATLTQLNTDIDELVNIFSSSIPDMDIALADPLTPGDVVDRIKKDKLIYEAYIKGLTDLKTKINTVLVHASFRYDGSGILNEEKVGDMKITRNKRIGDELNELSQVDIDLNDPEFVKQFDSDEKKKGCTAVVLEGTSEIVKIQLGAERLYMKVDDKGTQSPDFKLQNNWLKMVQTIKNQFSRFMYVQEVDPISLAKKMSGDQLKELSSSTGVLSVVNDIKKYDTTDKNPKLKPLVIMDKFERDGDLGFLDVGGKSIVYCVDRLKIEDKTYFTYRIVGACNYSGMTNDTTSPDFSAYVKTDVGSFPSFFKPIIPTLSSTLEHVATFIIGKENHLSRNSDNNVNILFVYGPRGTKKIETLVQFNTCRLYCKSKTGTSDIRIIDAAVTVDDNSVIKINISSPIMIRGSATSKFGLVDQNEFNLKNLGKDNLNVNLKQLKKT